MGKQLAQNEQGSGWIAGPKLVGGGRKTACITGILCIPIAQCLAACAQICLQCLTFKVNISKDCAASHFKFLIPGFFHLLMLLGHL